MQLTRWIKTLAVATALGLSATLEGRAQSGGLRAEVDSLHSAMIAAFKRDPASVASFYADDARIIGMGTRVSGREGVNRYWGQGMAATDWKLDVVEVGGTRDEPWVLARSTLVSTSGRNMTTDYLAVLTRGKDGRLRYRIDLFTPAESPMRRP
jgi:ketosteroid isomerase-like protein